MNLYAIVRRSGWASPEELQEAAERSTKVGNEEMPDEVRWRLMLRGRRHRAGQARTTLCALALVIAGLLVSAASAGAATLHADLLKDIRPGANGSGPDGFTNVNGTAFFSAFDDTNGGELWKSDGTSDGTKLVKDINPGSGGSSSGSLTNLNGTLFFSAFDGTHGVELWRSDGTAGGTTLVKDIAPGANSGAPSGLTSMGGTLFLRASDGANGFELWKSDGTSAGTTLVKDINPGASGSALGALTDVNGTLFFQANDGTSGAELWSAHYVPDVPVITGSSPSSPANENSPRIVGSAEAGTTVRLYASADCTGPVVTTGSPAAFASGLAVPVADDSSSTFAATATNAGGHSSPCSAAFTYVEDSTPPSASIDSGPSGLTNDPRPTFGFSSNDAGATFACSLDQGTASFGACSGARSHQPASNLADGSYTFRVKATDQAGNSAIATRSFTVDATPPETQIGSGPANGATIADPTPTFGFSSSESGSRFACSVDGASFTACTSPHTTSSLADGSHTFAVRATDPAGNTDPTSASRSFTVDTTPPRTTIISGLAAGAYTRDTTPTFGFAANEAGSRFQCRVDAGAYAPCRSPRTLGPLVNGAHTFRVRAIDKAGNVGAAASRSFHVDTVAPAVTITGPATVKTVYTSARVRFSFKASEPVRYRCRLDAGTLKPCASPYTTPKLGIGRHKLTVRATDRARNVSTRTKAFRIVKGR